MTFTASQIASLVSGTVEGNENATIHSFGKIEEAREGQICFLGNPKYEEHLYTTNASIIILNKDFELKESVKPTLILVEDAYSAFAILLAKYQEYTQDNLIGIEPQSYVSAKAIMGNQIYVGAFTYVSDGATIGDFTKVYPQTFIGKNVTIGKNCIIYPGVKIYNDCHLGDHVIIHSGAIIGSDGFGFAPQKDGSFQKIPQLGKVIIESHVEIGANTTIDRATIDVTVIRQGAKLDNLIQIAHNVEIGKSTVIAAQAGISGSTKIGDGVLIGGQAGIVGHIQLGTGAKVNAQSGVTKSLDAGQIVTGSPAFDYTAALRAQAIIKKLPELVKRVTELEQALEQLKSLKPLS